MPKRATPDPSAQGIYLRKKTYWLRNTVDGVRYFQNLRTHEFTEAIEKAKKLRGIRPKGKSKVGAWHKAIKKYIADKLAGICPAHLARKRLKSFRLDTAPGVKSCLKVFSERCGAATPAQVTLKQLQAYYDKRAKNSEAGARSTIATIQAFLDYIQCLPGRVTFDRDSKPEVRTIVVPVETSNAWIQDCKTPYLKFVLYCGFHTGLRRREIMHSRVQWFDLKRRVLTVPGKEAQILPSGKRYAWKSKDGETREIPLSIEFCLFLEKFLRNPNREYCMLSRRKSVTGLYDFRAPFQKIMLENERPEVTRHAMRHSWITELCNSGNHSITEVAAWSGDTVDTIEKNYWKKRVRTGALDDTMAGKRSGDAIKEVAESLKTISMAGLDQETIKAVQNLVKAAERDQDPHWEWTKEAPQIQVAKYSVEDTVNLFGVFSELIDPGADDPDATVTEFDWEEGKISTVRARLRLLEGRNLIQRVDGKS